MMRVVTKYCPYTLVYMHRHKHAYNLITAPRKETI